MTVRAITALRTQLVWTSSMAITVSVLQVSKEYTASQVSTNMIEIGVGFLLSIEGNKCLHVLLLQTHA